MLGLMYAVASYLAFLAVFIYFAFFSDGVVVPKHVDSGLASPLGSTLAVNVVLLLAFGLQHSIMARGWFKRRLTRFVRPSLERSTFVLASSVVLALLIYFWRPIPTVLWRVENPVAVPVLWGINAIGWCGVPATTFMIDHFHLVGLKQALSDFRRTSFERKGFVTPLLYKYVRHPMMTSLLVALWATPRMTVGHLLLSIGMTVYIFVGVHFEERALIEELGTAYVHYKATTPRFLPVGGAKVTEVEPPPSAPSPRAST